MSVFQVIEALCRSTGSAYTLRSSLSLPGSLSAHPCLSVIPYTSPQLYTFTLYPSVELSFPALIQLGFIKPDHWRIRVVLFLALNRSVCVCVCAPQSECVRKTELVFAFM